MDGEGQVKKYGRLGKLDETVEEYQEIYGIIVLQKYCKEEGLIGDWQTNWQTLEKNDGLLLKIV